MAVVNLFSRRKRVASGKTPDVYKYDVLPQTLRVQIVQIMRDAVGAYHQYSNLEIGEVYENNQGWIIIHDSVAREHGVFRIGRWIKSPPFL